MYKDEFVLKNIVWALRLKVYFNMTNEEIKKNLIYVTDTPGLQDPVAKEAIKILDKETDNYEVWKNWKYNQLVNPHIDEQIWSIDPTWVEKMGRLNNINSAKLLFHQYPMTTAALLSWFKIKNYELNCIRTAVESIKLNMNSNDAMNIIGIN